MSATEQSLLPETILYIEDIEANIKVVQAILKSQAPATQLLAVKNAEEGMLLAIEQQPGLILMDINLPEMNGLEATRCLKQDARTAAIPVIALTADAMPQQVEMANDIGFSAYITKPINVPAFLQTLASVYQASLEQQNSE